jgi:hypothetical protein
MMFGTWKLTVNLQLIWVITFKCIKIKFKSFISRMGCFDWDRLVSLLEWSSISKLFKLSKSYLKPKFSLFGSWKSITPYLLCFTIFSSASFSSKTYLNCSVEPLNLCFWFFIWREWDNFYISSQSINTICFLLHNQELFLHFGLNL